MYYCGFRLWPGYSNNDCFLVERPRIQYVLNLKGWMSQLLFSLCWNPEELGSNSLKVTPRHMTLPVKGESKQANTKSLLLSCAFKEATRRDDQM